MSLEEKALQLSQAGVADIIQVENAAVVGIPHAGVDGENIGDLGSVNNFGGIEEAKRIRSASFARKDNPLILMEDVIHGFRTVYPINVAIGGTFDLDLAEECAELAAIEARANGVNVTIAPMVDLSRDARWGRVGESTGEDPYLNGQMGRAFIRGFHKGGIACCVKHFAAYGAAEAGRDYNTTDISDHTLKEYYLKSYLECLKENPELLMTSFNLLNGIPVNGHRELLVELLREQEKFDGVLISDWGGFAEMTAHGYAADLKECACIAANNEVDIDMPVLVYAKYLPTLVREGKVSEETVNRMVRRVLRLKEKLGLYENASIGIDEEKNRTYCLSLDARDIVRKAAEDACVLLKNDGALPLQADEKVCLIGPFARSKDILGAWSCLGKAEDTVSVYDGIWRLTGKCVPTASACSERLFDDDDSGFAEALRLARKSDTVIVCLGEHCDDSGESRSRADIVLSPLQMCLLRKLKKTGKKIVLVVFAGRPLALTDAVSFADAVLFCWHPGTEGGNAIANLLYGVVNPSGKLTMSLPRSVGQCPVYYNHFATGKPKSPDTLENHRFTSSYIDELNEPLYPFGYGLSYTSFSLSDIEISSDEMKRNGSVTVCGQLKNIGECSGREVVQLYIRDKSGSCARPVKELKGFRKIALAAGEEQEIRFVISEETLAYFTASGEYKAEAGEFEIMLGTNSRDTIGVSLKLSD